MRELLFAMKNLVRGTGGVIAELANMGFEIDSHPSARKHLADFLSKSSPEELITLTDRLGWVDEKRSAFVLGSGRVIGNGSYRPVFDVPTEHQEASKPRGM